MEENYMATTRNGHELKDMYNPETNTLDIRSNGLYPSNVLSNLCSNAFVFDGVECGSMEGFLQSLKCKDEERQKQICAMKGGEAKFLALLLVVCFVPYPHSHGESILQHLLM